MSSRIEQIIEEIEEYIDRDCKFQPLSTTKIIVNKEHLEELLRELRLKTPDEIKRYQKIIANRDAILADAQAKADAMIEEAQVQTTELVSEHEIMQQAYAQANEIVTHGQLRWKKFSQPVQQRIRMKLKQDYTKRTTFMYAKTKWQNQLYSSLYSRELTASTTVQMRLSVQVPIPSLRYSKT